MKMLKGLTFSALPDLAKDPTLDRRMKLLKRLEEQKSLALDPTVTRTVTRRLTAEDGSKKVVQEAKIIRPWWNDNPTGGLLMVVRYGGRCLEFEKGKAAISLSGRNDLLPAIDSLIAATKAGDLDPLLAQQSKPRAGRKSKGSAQ